jgi:hypothetical protein
VSGGITTEEAAQLWVASLGVEASTRHTYLSVLRDVLRDVWSKESMNVDMGSINAELQRRYNRYFHRGQMSSVRSVLRRFVAWLCQENHILEPDEELLPLPPPKPKLNPAAAAPQKPLPLCQSSTFIPVMIPTSLLSEVYELLARRLKADVALDIRFEQENPFKGMVIHTVRNE